MSKRIISNFVISPELKELIDLASKNKGLSVSSLIRMILIEWLNTNGYVTKSK